MQKYVLRSVDDKNTDGLKNYSSFLANLLYFRGIENVEDAEKFLNPDYEKSNHDSFLMKDMDRAVERILQAIEKEEKILIYSDYDADGIPGAVILADFFTKINFKNFENYIPHRNNEGYGLNLEAIENFRKRGVDLIITIDCGTTDFKEIVLAQKFGIDVVVTDHHFVGDNEVEAFAFLNPQRNDCGYPNKMICGAGVVFKLVQAILQKKDFGLKKGWEKWLLDMVGLATIADMVPVIGENRAFAYFGLKVLKRSFRLGLLHLFKKTKINQHELNEDDIGFLISPRINAASRIGEPMKAFDLLFTKNEVEAGKLSDYLDNLNNERKILVASFVKEANKKLKERDIGDVVVIGSPKWNPGLSGLVANSLAERYQKTCFVWGKGGDGIIKGSCRSCGKVDVVDLMNFVPDEFFLNIGGHSLAGGFSLDHKNIHLLEDKLNEAFGKVEKNKNKKELLVDKKISLDDVNWENYKIIDKFAPFGVGNPKPLFVIEEIEIFDIRIFGKTKNHLGLDFLNSERRKVSAIKFFAEEIEDGEIKLKKGDRVNILVNLEKSTFRNVNELRLRIVDFV